ncbi:MAG: amidohydrolase [Verrucomicrobiota bacterium]|nr:amidohydrolase [Verrucomicrobiota bacterium]
MSIFIKDVLLRDKRRTNIFIDGNIIKSVGSIIKDADTIIDGTSMLALSPFYNMHTHAAMTLFRGYAEDLPLMEWLQSYIWPKEAKLTEEDVYNGARLACLEMIKSGTVFFMDMYWHLAGTYRAVEEMGLRANLSSVLIDNFDKKNAEDTKKRCKEEVFEFSDKNERISIALGPHAIYTVSTELLQWAGDFAKEKNLLYHIHLSETEFEVNECIKKHRCRPFEYMDKLGILSPETYAAHSNWLSEKEIALIADSNAKAIANPVSNMKLVSGRTCPIIALENAGATVLLGTDGCSSNNNLDMMEEMKIAAILQKHFSGKNTNMPAEHILHVTTKFPPSAMGINAGQIAPGKLADIILLNLNIPEARPLHDPVSNIVYSMNGSSVDTMICNGEILMQNRKVPKEEEIIRKAEESAFKIIQT